MKELKRNEVEALQRRLEQREEDLKQLQRPLQRREEEVVPGGGPAWPPASDQCRGKRECALEENASISKVKIKKKTRHMGDFGNPELQNSILSKPKSILCVIEILGNLINTCPFVPQWPVQSLPWEPPPKRLFPHGVVAYLVSCHVGTQVADCSLVFQVGPSITVSEILHMACTGCLVR